MKKWTMVLVYMAYTVAVLAIIEGFCKEMYINGIAVGYGLAWLGSKIKKEANTYGTESN